MRSTTAVLSAFLAVAHGQNIISAKGQSGVSKALQVDINDPFDMNFIKQADIVSNAVNECGRTLNGNIDIGANTELALSNGEVTKVTKGSKVQIQISQDNAQMSAGPFTCDLDDQSNAKGGTGQIKLQQANAAGGNAAGNANNAAGGNRGGNGANRGKNAGGQRNRMRQLEVRHEVASRIGARANAMTLTVTMPSDLACTGSSAGNVCTVRCINKQEVGGCFAVQQTDTKALPGNNQPGNIKTAQTKEGIDVQVLQNKQDFNAAAAAIADTAGSTDKNTQDKAQAAAVAKAVVAIQAKLGVVTAADLNGNTGNNNNGANAGNANAGNANAGNANAGNANAGKANAGNAKANAGANRGGNGANRGGN